MKTALSFPFPEPDKAIRMVFTACAAALLAGCEEPPAPLTGSPLEQRRREIRAEIEQALTDPAGSLLGDDAYTLREPALLAEAVAEVSERCEPWIAGDIERLRFFLKGHLDGARSRMLESEAGRKELERRINARFAAPRIERRVITTEGRGSGGLDRAIAHFGGLLLSGRATPALAFPPDEYVEIVADHGILPSPLEANETGKYNHLPVRFVRWNNPWMHPTDGSRPSDAVVARLLLERAAASPDASRIVLRLTVLPALGPPQMCSITAERGSVTGDALDIWIAQDGGGLAEESLRTLSLSELEKSATHALW